MTKADLRVEMQAVRRQAAFADPGAAGRLAAHWPPDLRPTIVAGYRPMRGELDPTPLLDRLMAGGARLSLPVTPPRGSDAPLTFRLWSPAEPLTRSGFGVDEPTDAATLATPDLVLTPLLAFTRKGGRLGWGQGHFDRTLRILRAAGPVLAVGVAYAAQMRHDIPIEPHDEPLDAILTETGYISARKDI